MNWYVDRDTLKSALGIPASTTGDHSLLDAAIDGVSRLIDDYLGYQAFSSSGTLYYTANNSILLYLDNPLLNVDNIDLDFSGAASYETAMATNCYYLKPYNATAENPRHPWWGMELRLSATTAFPQNIPRGVRIKGTWGLSNDVVSTTATLASGPTALQTTLDIVGATSLHVGQTLLIGSEQVFVVGSNVSSTGANTSQITVQRGVNGSVAASHASGATLQIYDYPLVGRAALFQAQMDYRAKDAPMGEAGGSPFGGQPMRPSAGGLHPFVRRMLDGFRTPVAG